MISFGSAYLTFVFCLVVIYRYLSGLQIPNQNLKLSPSHLLKTRSLLLDKE